MLEVIYENLGIIVVLACTLAMSGVLLMMPILGFFKKKRIEKELYETATRNQLQMKRRKELAKIKNEKDAESIAVLESKYADFLKSSERKYIERFAGKFSDKFNGSELLKLQFILKEKQWDFSLDDLRLLIEKEIKKQKFESIKFNLLSFSDRSPREIIKDYLAGYSSEDESLLEILRQILEEKGLAFSNLDELKNEVGEVKRQLEAADFANFLLHETRPPEKPILEALFLPITSNETSLQ